MNVANRRARQLGVEFIHRVGGLQNDHLLAGIDESIDQHMDRFIGAVRQQHLVFRDAKMCGQLALRLRVFRVNRDRFRTEAGLQKLRDPGRTTDGVFIKVETQFSLASAGGRRVGRHFFDRITRLKHGFSPPRNERALPVLPRAPAE